MHIHTDYSYDGRDSLQDVAQLARRKGYSFLLLTEHNDVFDDEKMRRFVAECERLSTTDFTIIPGLEVNCDFGRHLLAIGIRKYIGMADPEKVIDKIKENGGLAIFPHPGLHQFRSFLDTASNLDGVEVWNSRYDSKFAPNPKSFSLLKNLRKENPGVFAYGGQDLHSVQELDDLCLRIELSRPSEFEILHRLEKGRFEVVRRRMAIGSVGDITKTQKVLFDIVASADMLGKALWSS
ncbi:MAG: PHP domain-containing protein [Thermodesulfobacteriota bacterium]|nr:PHP domain-containing protein [Thermodesulfobacteriota bacterium]